MTVLIGSARINENGKGEGGQPGDQSKKEVCTERWYLHKSGWVVIRAKNPQMRLSIAKDMQAACDNDNIGYSYWEHCMTLMEEVKKFGYDCSKVKKKCETNCAKLVLVCAKYAGSKVADFYTGDEVEKFKATGEFEILTEDKYCKSPDYLLTGDILVTKTKGHTAVVLTDGVKAVGKPHKIYKCVACRLRDSGSTKGKHIQFMHPGDVVIVNGYAPSGWAYVKTTDYKVGYVAPQYVTPVTKVKTTAKVWLRSVAGTGNPSILTIPKGTTMAWDGVFGTVDGTVWYNVKYGGSNGFSSGKYITPV